MIYGDGTEFLNLVILALGLTALYVLLTSLLPHHIEQARSVMRAQPGRSFLVGLVNAFFFGAGVLLANSYVQPLQIVAVVSLFILLSMLLLGLLTAAGIAGERIWIQVADHPATLVGSLALGMLILFLVLLVPVFGWLLILILTLIGLGAVLVMGVGRIKARSQDGDGLAPTPESPD